MSSNLSCELLSNGLYRIFDYASKMSGLYQVRLYTGGAWQGQIRDVRCKGGFDFGEDARAMVRRNKAWLMRYEASHKA